MAPKNYSSTEKGKAMPTIIVHYFVDRINAAQLNFQLHVDLMARIFSPLRRIIHRKAFLLTLYEATYAWELKTLFWAFENIALVYIY